MTQPSSSEGIYKCLKLIKYHHDSSYKAKYHTSSSIRSTVELYQPFLLPYQAIMKCGPPAKVKELEGIYSGCVSYPVKHLRPYLNV
jgi:hypothetical protein